MNNEVKEYIVSSADWSFEIDDVNPRDAAISGILFAMKAYSKNLLMSTVIMVNEKKFHTKNKVYFADFFSTYEILKDIGMPKEANEFLNFYKQKNEAEYTQ